MAKFDINKKGYDIEQVDNFINKLTLKYEEKLSEQKDRVFSLKNELTTLQDRLDGYKDKDKQISQALIFAVEKAEQIEGNASKLYDLEIKRLRLLYKQWEELALDLLGMELSTKVKDRLKNFNTTVQEVLEQNKRIGSSLIRQDLHKNSDNYIRNLLNKMDYAMNSKSKNVIDKSTLAALSSENEKENNRIIDVSGSLDSIKADGLGSMVDNYLNSDIEDSSSVFAKTFTKRPIKNKEKPFDLDEVLTPKEDLDEIMKAFDFFMKNNKD
jgi:cell division septum initiation protein DivIVA